MSDTPFSDGFKAPFAPGVWWYIVYSAQAPYDSRIATISRKFNDRPTEFPIDRVDYCQKSIQDMEVNKGKQILILSWSMFTVPEAPSDV